MEEDLETSANWQPILGVLGPEYKSLGQKEFEQWGRRGGVRRMQDQCL